MNFWSYIYTLIIGPLELVFEIIFSVINRYISNPGVTVILESLVLNLVLYPLYRHADGIQSKAADCERKMKPMVQHIKQHFKGDERMMMLQTYYRECHYSPFNIVKTSLPVLLQIPFFLAAYNMLQNNRELADTAFGPIANLGAVDGLIVIGTLTINLLPILMTLINVISSFIYARKMPASTQIQLYIMAALFLVVLYKSPSGLVLYWTFNNLFALIKNVYFKLVPSNTTKKQASVKNHKLAKITKQDKLLFLFGCLSSGLLVGYYLPSLVLSISTQEFINLYAVSNPLIYLVRTVLTGIGLFVVWPSVFYFVFPDTGKRVMVYIMCALSLSMLITSQLFSNDFGTMNKELAYYGIPEFTWANILINIGACILVVVMIVLMLRLLKGFTMVIMVALTCVYLVAGTLFALSSNRFYQSFLDNSVREGTPQFTLSQNGKNVVVIMLDRALGPMLPYIFNENPELESQFDGFTYYSNTISYGPNTNFCTPSLFGGYDYTPVRLNERDDELLENKHDEALKVLPTIFTNNGYDCTFVNPTYAGYSWIADLTVFDGMQGVSVYNTLNKYARIDYGDTYDDIITHNLFCYSLFKSSAVAIQPLLYDDGNYNDLSVRSAEQTSQRITSNSEAVGHNMDFEMSYYALKALSDMTVIDEGASDNVLLYTCDCTHDTALLQEPDYEPTDVVDNREYDAANAARFTLDGRTMAMDDSEDYSHYESDTAALMAVGEWLDYLRANDLYDNTRIIIVSDHGNCIGQFEELDESELEVPVDAETFTPLLMVKDFGSTGFTVSDEFMTNADTAYLATEGIIDNPTNPFTGNAISEEDKQGPQMIINSGLMDINVNNGTTFASGDWYTVQRDIWNKDNWTYEGNH